MGNPSKSTQWARILANVLEAGGPPVAKILAVGGVLYLLGFDELIGSITSIYTRALDTEGVVVSVSGSLWGLLGAVGGILVGLAVGWNGSSGNTSDSPPTS